MKKSSTVILQLAIVLFGIAVFVWMLWEPHLEGRNVNATLSQIYFHDPFLVYAYTASIAFFVAVWQAFKILGFIRENKTFSLATARAFRIIKYCATVIVAFVLGAEAYLFIVRPEDDIAGGVFMGLLVIFASGVVAIVAGMLENILHNAVGIKS